MMCAKLTDLAVFRLEHHRLRPLRVVASSTISTETTPIRTNRDTAAEEAIRFRKAQEDRARREKEEYKRRLAAQDARTGRPPFQAFGPPGPLPTSSILSQAETSRRTTSPDRQSRSRSPSKR